MGHESLGVGAGMIEGEYVEQELTLGTLYASEVDPGTVAKVNAEDGSEGWTFDATGRFIFGTTVYDDDVFFADNYWWVYRLDGEDGSKLWETELDTVVRYVPSIVDGSVYVGDVGGAFYSLDAGNGDIEWKNTDAASDYAFHSPWVDVGSGTVYAGDWDGVLRAFDIADGSQKWSYPTGGTISVTPKRVGDVVYVGDHNGGFYEIGASGGAENWSITISDNDAVYGFSVYDGTAYLSTGYTGFIRAIDLSDKSESWSFDAGMDTDFNGPTIYDDVLYVSDTNGNLYAVDIDDGSKVWEFNTPDIPESHPIYSNGYVYFNSGSIVYKIDVSDGSEVWRYEERSSDTYYNFGSAADGYNRVNRPGAHNGNTELL